MTTTARSLLSLAACSLLLQNRNPPAAPSLTSVQLGVQIQE